MSIEESGPFSHPSRVSLISTYFGDRRVSPAEAWKDVYRLLLWADPTTGLAHCYESDKSQPGRPWYARTLAFHAWVAREFGVANDELADELDWMFRQVIRRVADLAERATRAPRGEQQRAPYSETMPVPGEDPELRQLIEPLLPPPGPTRPSDEVVRDVLHRVRAHIGSENKRKNLLGRGFEDVIAAVIQRTDGAPEVIGTQTPVEEVDGFRSPRSGDKTEKVDLWVRGYDGSRTIATAKWSVRADREKQMRNDFLTYVSLNELREPFRYVWITNEFDAARLVANATNAEANQLMFDSVVHVCPWALSVVHELDRAALPRTPARLKELLESGRITGLADWLTALSA